MFVGCSLFLRWNTLPDTLKFPILAFVFRFSFVRLSFFVRSFVRSCTRTNISSTHMIGQSVKRSFTRTQGSIPIQSFVCTNARFGSSARTLHLVRLHERYIWFVCTNATFGSSTRTLHLVRLHERYIWFVYTKVFGSFVQTL